MDKSNILSEKLTLGDVFKYLTSSNFKDLSKKVPAKNLKKKLTDMNSNVKEIERLVKSLYNQDITLPQYTDKDLKGNK
tara:strand:- start:85 stop:318 length:234 start_codon:yes stop_codon:yes gene_type:complete